MEGIELLNAQIPKCFGSVDKVFAGHPSEEAETEKAVRICKQHGIPLQTCLGLFNNWLRQNTSPEHTEEQAREVARFFKKTLK